MIEGLKVTVDGAELRDLCLARAKHHQERAKAYGEQLANFEASQIEGMQYTNGDPKRALGDKQAEHDGEAQEMKFIAEHLVLTESYLLDRSDLNRLGITRSRY